MLSHYLIQHQTSTRPRVWNWETVHAGTQWLTFIKSSCSLQEEFHTYSLWDSNQQLTYLWSACPSFKFGHISCSVSLVCVTCVTWRSADDDRPSRRHSFRLNTVTRLLLLQHSSQTLTCRAALSLLFCCFRMWTSFSHSSFSTCARLWALWHLWRSWFRLSTSFLSTLSWPLEVFADSLAAWRSSLNSCTFAFK